MPFPAIVGALLGGENNPISKLINLIPDPNEKRKMQQELELHFMQAVAQLDTAQMDINKTEAATGNMFIAGWRPFIGWVCGFALAWTYVGSPFAVFVLSFTPYSNVVLPNIANDQLFELVLGMLGMSGLRTFEKFHGVTQAPETPKKPLRDIFKRRKKPEGTK